jgi:hypothetical protein
MTGTDPKADLRRYLQEGRDAMLWKLDGLSEYDIRRPLVPTGTALAISKVSPYVAAAILSGWTIAYSAHLKRKGERTGAVAGEKPGSGSTDPASPEVTEA